MVALSAQRASGGLGQVGIGLQGFVKHLHLPPFFVARSDSVVVASQVTAHQMQYPRAVVFVFKDLADHQDCFRIALEPALHGGLLGEVQLIYTDKALLFSILFALRNQAVVLEGCNEMPALTRDELEVLL